MSVFVLCSHVCQYDDSMMVEAQALEALCPGPNLSCNPIYLGGLGQLAQCLKPQFSHLRNGDDICTSLPAKSAEKIKSGDAHELLSTTP